MLMLLTSNEIDIEDPGAVPGASTINTRLKYSPPSSGMSAE